MGTERLTGVILAGGEGRRMGSIGEASPKILLPILNRPLLAYQFDHLRDANCASVLIAVRTSSPALEAVVREERGNLSAEIITPASHQGIAHTLLALEEEIEGSFCLLLGDIDFRAEDLGCVTDRFLANRGGAIVAAREESDRARRAKNFTVVCDGEGRVERVIEKARYHASTLMGCGVYWFGPEIFDAIRCTPRSLLRDEYELTDAIQVLIGMGIPVEVTRMVLEDTNISTPEDLLACNLKRLKEAGKEADIGRGAAVHPGARVIDSVVGEEARIESPVEVRESLLLPGSVVSGAKDVKGCVIGKEGILS
ncbi:MAG: sugar phosphate nucleotidyltransferase [Planctomycetota bacterium]|jgi:dTDP-glucose pyrophosphorylase